MNRQQLAKLNKLADSGLDLDALIRQATTEPPKPRAWTVQNLAIPDGAYLRLWYKDRPYWGTVADGCFVMNGKTYDTPSAAATVIYGRPTNGWDVWEIKLPRAKGFVRLSELRTTRRIH